MRFVDETTLAMIEQIARDKPNSHVVYSVGTCWWKIGDPIYSKDGSGLPCDPRGALLMECHDLAGFLKNAKENVSHYGKHGMRAFVAAYHGNVLTDDHKPTCFESWDDYNKLIEAKNGLPDSRSEDGGSDEGQNRLCG